ncbi:MAG: 16S rRNA (cytosine(1402)-N(4))-methyltransferase RsmH [Spirochaetaceae bacterium]|nr:16S rRNA (cytosine(1402)-N(4))-methyltransferase RsmH [Spirochaetaceae bacterium]MBO4706448.1 16S rRNA (cytosine(1402)-N(4))-methyltransferase RsmH [Spirochaetaceae bacterium]
MEQECGVAGALSNLEIVHTPVLLHETLEYLSPVGEPYADDAFMVDSTLGEGGHSEAFLKRFENLRIIGLDADPKIQARAKQRLMPFGNRMSFHQGWFNDFYANYPDSLPKPDLILFDLGISVFHYERSGRGFSFRYDEPLDMRLNPDAGDSVETVVNTKSEKELADIIYMYGEERYSRRIASAICEARRMSRIVSSKVLADIIYRAVPAPYRHGAIHPATKSFQALRIAVNHELDNIPPALSSAFSVLKTGGKMGVITFHSLEDRIVKNIFRDLAKACICPPEQAICTCGGKPRAELLTRKPVAPTDDEVSENSPSRSAKLRVIRKLR